MLEALNLGSSIPFMRNLSFNIHSYNKAKGILLKYIVRIQEIDKYICV